jgi:hypothetical protein
MSDYTHITARGFVTITDKETGEVIFENNAIHFGNLTAAVALSLAGYTTGHARYMAFGNGGSSTDSTGEISYKDPNVYELRDINASLYNQTAVKNLEDVNDPDNNITVSLSATDYADVKFKATLGYGEPIDQEDLDTAVNNDGQYVFDEIGILDAQDILLTHVIFHPVQKSLNRVFEVDYTIRIQMGDPL